MDALTYGGRARLSLGGASDHARRGQPHRGEHRQAAGDASKGLNCGSARPKLAPHIGLDPNQLLLLQGAENRSPVKVNGSEPKASSPLRRRSQGMGVSSA
jgi:hypothetical protein